MKKNSSRRLVAVSAYDPDSESSLGVDVVIDYHSSQTPGQVHAITQGIVSHYVVNSLSQSNVHSLLESESWREKICNNLKLPGCKLLTTKVENIREIPCFIPTDSVTEESWNEVPVSFTDSRGRTLSFILEFMHHIPKSQRPAFKEHVLGLATRFMVRQGDEMDSAYVWYKHIVNDPTKWESRLLRFLADDGVNNVKFRSVEFINYNK